MDAECAVALVIPESLVEDNGCDPAGRGRDNLWEAVAGVAEVRAVVRAVAEMVVAVRVAAVRVAGRAVAAMEVATAAVRMLPAHTTAP